MCMLLYDITEQFFHIRNDYLIRFKKKIIQYGFFMIF